MHALEDVAKEYEAHKDNPPIERNQTFVCGGIRWARQLSRTVSMPMEVFTKYSSIVLARPEAKKTVKLYNRLAQALLRFEENYFEAWTKQIKDAKLALQV